MIITPARNATPVSIISICDTALFRFTSFLTYEPYVIIIPIDTLREKNSWLIASSVICRKRPTVIPVRSGFIYTLSPCNPVRTVPSSSVVFNVSEKIAIPITIISRTGMINFETRSIPSSTPLYTINAVSSIKINPYHTDDGEEMNAVKQSSATACFPELVR